jgi:hypothetical protein
MPGGMADKDEQYVCLPSWNPEDGCIPDLLLLAIYNEMLPEEEELRLYAHIAKCGQCDERLGSLPEGTTPSLLSRVSTATTPAEEKELLRQWLKKRREGLKAVKSMKWPS